MRRTIAITMAAPEAADYSGSEVPRSSPFAEEGRRPSLVLRVFLGNAAVLALVLLLLAVTPITISAPIALEQLLFLVAGFVAMLAMDLFLLRWLLLPLRRLTALTASIDPNRPGRRLTGVEPRAWEVAALVDAFNRMLDRLETERRESARAALAAQERERIRIARELHDEIGQMLTAVAIQADRAAEDGAGEPSRALRTIADDIRTSLDDVRRIARELRPEALDDLGLVNALITLCTRVAAQGKLRVERRLDAEIPSLGPEVELVIYRVAQEALTNVLRHAHASRATVSLHADERTVILRVRDNGRGLPPETPPGTAGISGMRERARLIGARLTVQSKPGQGVEVELEFPLGLVDR
jgi:two-component system, NarL family, sensor histidine kinase UhpB